MLSLSGIGNFLMQSPTIEAIKKARPDWHITVWVAPRNTAVLAKANPHVDEVIRAPIKRSILGHLRHVWKLRQSHYNIGIVLSPGQLWKSAAYLFLAGIPQRIGHQYPHLGKQNSAFLLTNAIPEDPTLHDIEQNLALLQSLKINYSLQTTNYSLEIPPTQQAEAEQVITKLHIPQDRTLIGIHPGSAPHFLWKRWPVNNFATVAKTLIKKHDAHILIFGGPDELKLKKQLRDLIGKQNCTIISAKLLISAAIIKQCHIFVSNDSGLMHIAAATGTKTYSLFGPTNETKTGPRGANSHIIRAPHTEPVYNTEHNPDLGTEPHDTLLKLTPQLVLDRIYESPPSSHSHLDA